MKQVRNVVFMVLVSLVVFPALARSEGGDGLNLALGAGVRVSTSEYKGEDMSISPIPIIAYEGEYLFVKGLKAGAFLYRDEINALTVHVGYLSQSFDADGNDDRDMRRLDDRDSSMLAGVGYEARTSWGTAALSLSADVLGVSDGIIADASYAYPVQYSFLKLKPFVGLEWTSENYNDYYYGVTSTESARSGLAAYEADGGLSPYLGLGVRVDLSEAIGMTASAKSRWLSDEVTDSPMVDEDVVHSFSLGFTYAF